jgi:hypothetical protein
VQPAHRRRRQRTAHPGTRRGQRQAMRRRQRTAHRSTRRGQRQAKGGRWWTTRTAARDPEGLRPRAPRTAPASR